MIKSGTIIVDSTHTDAAVRAKSPTQILRDLSKQLRKEIYKKAYELSEKFPEKPSVEADLNEEIAYTEELLSVLKEDITNCGDKKIQKLSGKIEELLKTQKIREIRSKDDEDARFGHKTPTRLIAGIHVTSGGAPDGQQLPELIEKSKKNGIEVTEVVGDMAYVSEENLDACGEEIALIARTNSAVEQQRMQG